QDPNLSRMQLAQIRRKEELAALAELGIPGDHYINLGYDDGLLEFEDRKAVVENLVRWIRKLRPDVLFAWDPSKNYQRWHKSDHRAAAYLAADAARAAMWRLLFEGQITQEGLKEYMIPEYLFFNDYDYGDENITVDISDFVEKKVSAGAKYISQFRSEEHTSELQSRFDLVCRLLLEKKKKNKTKNKLYSLKPKSYTKVSGR